MEKIKIVQFGCGPIGCGVVGLALKKANLEIVGAIDLINLGLDLGEVAKLDRKLGVRISSEADRIIREAQPDVVLHTTSSSLKSIYPQLESIIKVRSP